MLTAEFKIGVSKIKKIFLMLTLLFVLIGYDVLGQDIMQSTPGPKYKIDGQMDEWVSPVLLTDEVGGAGPGMFKNNVDIQRMYIETDSDYLYFYFTCEPSLNRQFKESQSSGIFAYIYFDIDQNTRTGALTVDHSGKDAMLGSEVRIWMPLGITTSLPSGKTECFLSLDISYVEKEKSAFGKPKYRFTSLENPSVVAYSEKGVEIAIPKKSIQLKDGDDFDIIVLEWAHIFDAKEMRFSIKTP